MVTTKELVNSIIKQYLKSACCDKQSTLFDMYKDIENKELSAIESSLIEYGRKKGWLEELDEDYFNYPVDRKNAARIIHQFVLIECGFVEERNWEKAKKLKDLYDCRVCAKHIAYVFEKDIMPSKEADRFKLLDKLEEAELMLIVDRLKEHMLSYM